MAPPQRKQQFFGKCGFSRIGMANDGKRAPALYFFF
jgi:hypothetical protein